MRFKLTILNNFNIISIWIIYSNRVNERALRLRSGRTNPYLLAFRQEKDCSVKHDPPVGGDASRKVGTPKFLLKITRISA